ncbi:MAG: VOC family protein [Flavobacterium sp.]|uniref:VOC family protein n=1 Tax=Flavobacterium sp. TaxID=239 RepID=UPI00120C36EF|nr:VOC family protein [Flavobacterium sp.]RZJ67750.1 MAG: VOC family protein [Flavobacterium sp.]
MPDFKPKNYNSVSPYLIVDGAQRLADLLKTIFDTEELRKYNREDGSVMHMEVRVDDSVLMISDATEDYPADATMLHVYVSDVDAVYKKAIDNGCQPIEKPENKNGDPDKRGSFLDFAGNYWSVSTQI